MSLSTSASCAVIVSQQQQQQVHHQNQFEDIPDDGAKTVHTNCTVVEDGLVVVKPVTKQSDRSSKD
jgi:hypothetical protein